MFVLVDVLDEHAEERIRKPARARRVRKIPVNDEYSNPRKDDAEAEAMKPYECILWPDNAIVVAIEEVAVLLQDSLVRVLFGPVVVCGTLRRFR